jgi:hypothetical protein
MRASQYIKVNPASLPADHPPILLVVIDTEEEFDWGKPHDRKATSVSAIREIHRAQDIFDEFRIKPTYVVDYPIASQAESVSVLSPIQNSGRAEIGAHLHPWVSPPFEEAVNAFNSYPGNLPRDLERRKLAALSESIRASFGIQPRIYKAGRYGFGPNTMGILGELGYDIDLSIAPPYNYEGDDGPDFTDMSPDACWIGTPGRLLALPATGGFVGALNSWGPRVHRLAQHKLIRHLHLVGILSRLGLLNHFRLSPEQYRFNELRLLTRVLIGAGVKVLSFTFHSPTLKPGCTPYVQDADDLKRFVNEFSTYFKYFFDEVGGARATPAEVKRLMWPSPETVT